MAFPIGAAISGVGSILGGITGGKGAARAARIQAEAYQKGIDETRRQFDITNTNFQPFLQSGYRGLTGFETLMGLLGPDAQGAAITALKQSPAFTSRYETGLDAILQGASATGGLRGGNTALAQSNFGSALLSDVIDRQLGGYGTLANFGMGAAGSLGNLGAQSSSQIADLLARQGGAQATGAAAPFAAAQQVFNGLGALGGTFFGGRRGGGGGQSSGGGW